MKTLIIVDTERNLYPEYIGLYKQNDTFGKICKALSHEELTAFYAAAEDKKHFIENTIIVKGNNIETSAFMKIVLPLCKKIDPKAFLSHCALFKCTLDALRKPFIMTDGAIIPYPNKDNLKRVIANAETLYYNLRPGRGAPKTVLINASGKDNVECLATEYLKEPQMSGLSLEQLDVALNKDIRRQKKIDGDTADIVIVNNINEGNILWKSLTALTHDIWLVAGIVAGTELKIGLNSRSDTDKSHQFTIDTLLLGSGLI
jgi:phosphotransacetylase